MQATEKDRERYEVWAQTKETIYDLNIIIEHGQLTTWREEQSRANVAKVQTELVGIGKEQRRAGRMLLRYEANQQEADLQRQLQGVGARSVVNCVHSITCYPQASHMNKFSAPLWQFSRHRTAWQLPVVSSSVAPQPLNCSFIHKRDTANYQQLQCKSLSHTDNTNWFVTTPGLRVMQQCLEDSCLLGWHCVLGLGFPTVLKKPISLTLKRPSEPLAQPLAPEDSFIH